jgi:hypothetical protein
MALSDLTFKLYTDSGLTEEFGGIAQYLHNSDLSDNPQDLQLWFGSNASNVQLQANSNPGVDNITLTPTDIMTVWAASVAKVVGNRVQPTVGDGYVYEVQSISGSGNTDATEPTWPASIGSTVVDNEVTWICVSKKHEPTEVKLASTSGGLAAATGGASLSLGTTLTSGVGNAVEVHMRVENAVDTVGTNSGNPGIGVDINLVDETAV